MKAIIVTGSRAHECRVDRYYDHPLCLALKVESPDLIIHGNQGWIIDGVIHGADRIAQFWYEMSQPLASCDDHSSIIAMDAQWDRLGRRAGPVRNGHMVAVGTALAQCGWIVRALAFPLQDSRGTWDCVSQAKAAGIPVEVHRV